MKLFFATPFAPDELPRAATAKQLSARAFSLLEVIVASAIFFLAMFSILSLTASNIRAARLIQRVPVDAAMLAAELSVTNRLEEGVETGDFGDLYPGYSWSRETYQVATNGLFRVDFMVRGSQESKNYESTMSILMFHPDSAVTSRGLGQ
jgi:Tfp pilus assembly protein PilV